MATKPRHLKTPMQLWVADNRKRLGLSPRDLAEMTGVTEDTARGWESRGAPSQDAIEVLTRRFGEQPPVAGSAGSDTPAGLADLLQGLIAAEIQTREMLLEEHQQTRAMFREVLDALGARTVDPAVAAGLERWVLAQAASPSPPQQSDPLPANGPRSP